MKSVFVLYGGPSVEHQVSVNSAKAVINALDRNKYHVHPVYITEEGVWLRLPELQKPFENITEMVRDPEGKTVAASLAEFLQSHDFSDGNTLFFPVLHGTYGEDGGVQGFFETLDVPYVGSNVTASAVCMDKAFANDVMEKNGIPQAKYAVLTRYQVQQKGIDPEALVEKLGLPLYVKPANCGSSVGVVRVTEAGQLESAVEEAMQFDHKVVLEEEIWGRELNVSVIGNEAPKGSIPGDFAMETGIFDFNLKYNNPEIVPIIPAKIPEDRFEELADLAARAYEALGCNGTARVDIFYTDDGEFKVNEINTMPGMSDLSMTPVLWEATDGTSYPALLDKLVEWGFDAYNKKKALVRTSECYRFL